VFSGFSTISFFSVLSERFVNFGEEFKSFKSFVDLSLFVSFNERFSEFEFERLEELPLESLLDLFPDKVPNPGEIYYYAKKFDFTGDILEEDVNYMIKLYMENGNILDEENSEVFNTKINCLY